MSFKGPSHCHCPETGTITSVPCVSTVNSNQGQPASPISYMHISQAQSRIFLSESIFLQAKSFAIFSLALAICKCQRVTYKTGRWKGMRTKTSNQGSAACTALDQRCFPPCIFQHNKRSTVQMHGHEKGAPEMQKDFNDWLSLGL